MKDFEIFVAKCAQSKTESVPVSTQEYVDGYAPIAFPPPSVGQFQKLQFVFLRDHSAKVVDGCDSIVPVLNYADILVAGVNAKRYKRIFIRQFFKDVIAH
jgi:hypothetical protein